jgi:hypothetical protein
MRFRPWGILAAVIGGGAYLAALLLPVATIFFLGGIVPFPGYMGFQVQWECLTSTDPQWDRDRVLAACSWFANPAIWIALVCLVIGWWRAAGLSGAAGLILCLVALPLFCGDRVVSGPGYWAWLGSAALPLVWGSVAAVRERRLRPWQPPGRVTLSFPPRLADGRWALPSDDEGEDDEGVTPRRPPEPEWMDGP